MTKLFGKKQTTPLATADTGALQSACTRAAHQQTFKSFTLQTFDTPWRQEQELRYEINPTLHPGKVGTQRIIDDNCIQLCCEWQKPGKSSFSVLLCRNVVNVVDNLVPDLSSPICFLLIRMTAHDMCFPAILAA